jgi:hypothetical protein
LSTTYYKAIAIATANPFEALVAISALAVLI